MSSQPDYSLAENLTTIADIAFKVENKERIILAGKAASGKDYAKNKLVEAGYPRAISFTTRPKREKETHGRDYFFVTEEEFLNKINKGDFYEYAVFCGWYYGTDRSQFHSARVFIMEPEGISQLSREDRETSFILYLDIPYEIRKQRLMERNDHDDPSRRLQADEEDFKNFTDFDFRITDPNFR